MVCLIEYFWNFTVQLYAGGSQESYVILIGGHAKCLLLITRGEGGGQKFQTPAYVIHGCSLRENLKRKLYKIFKLL